MNTSTIKIAPSQHKPDQLNLSEISHRDLLELLAKDSNNQAAIKEFIARYDRFIRGVIFKTLNQKDHGVRYINTPRGLEDLVNDVYIRLLRNDCRALTQFNGQYDNSIFSYLRSISANIARNHIRDSQRERYYKQTPFFSDDDERSADEYLELLASAAQRYDCDFSKAESKTLELVIRTKLQRMFNQTLVDRNFLIFKLHCLHGYKFNELANIKALGLNQNGISTTVSRIKYCLKHSLKSDEIN